MFGLQLSAQETVGDVLTSIGLLGGLIGLFFLGFQVKAGADQAREAAKQAAASVDQAIISAQQAQQTATAERGRFVLDVINRYFDDPEMLRLYFLLDSDSFVFDPETDTGRKDAAAVARTLYYFDTLGFLVNNKLISLEDVAILRYRIDAFFRSDEIQKVLHQRYERSRGRREPQGQVAHQLARDLAKQLQKLPSRLQGIV